METSRGCEHGSRRTPAIADASILLSAVFPVLTLARPGVVPRSTLLRAHARPIRRGHPLAHRRRIPRIRSSGPRRRAGRMDAYRPESLGKRVKVDQCGGNGSRLRWRRIAETEERGSVADVWADEGDDVDSGGWAVLLARRGDRWGRTNGTAAGPGGSWCDVLSRRWPGPSP